MEIESIYKLDQFICSVDSLLIPTLFIAFAMFFCYLVKQDSKSRKRIYVLFTIGAICISVWLIHIFLLGLIENQIKFAMKNLLRNPNVQIYYDQEKLDYKTSKRVASVISKTQFIVPNGTQTKSSAVIKIVSNDKIMNFYIREDSDVVNQYELVTMDFCRPYEVNRITASIFKVIERKKIEKIEKMDNKR